MNPTNKKRKLLYAALVSFLFALLIIAVSSAQPPATTLPVASKIAFMSLRDGNPEIYVMNVDGSEQTRLTNHPASDNQPVWSPDGSKIAFSSERDGNVEIYVMNADGSGQRRLTNHPAHDYEPA